jgi:hypothetical protein
MTRIVLLSFPVEIFQLSLGFGVFFGGSSMPDYGIVSRACFTQNSRMRPTTNLRARLARP